MIQSRSQNNHRHDSFQVLSYSNEFPEKRYFHRLLLLTTTNIPQAESDPFFEKLIYILMMFY
jgi:hypothetical protein